MAKTIIKKTETEAIVKISGTNTSETIVLATDLLTGTEIIQGTPTVGIRFIQWSQDQAATVAIIRGGTPVLDLHDNGNQFDFAGNGGFLELTGSTSDIVFTITGTSFVYITLRKIAGYKSKIEGHRFGSYDDINAVGS